MGFFPESIINFNMIGIFTLIAFLIPIRALLGLFTQFLRVEQRTKLLNSFNVAFRYVTMTLSLFLLIYFIKGLHGFIFGMILSNILGIAVLYWIISGNFNFTFTAFSPHLLRECIIFGLPLVFTEFGHTLLNLGDRYLIQYYLGLELLGVYSAGYNLTGYIGEAFVFAFRSSATPIYLRIWENDGEKKTNIFLSDSLRYLLLILLPVGFGFTCISKEIILLLASQKYVEAYIIIPWVMAGFVIFGTRIIFDAPLYIHKKTMTILILMSLSCIINIFMNVLLIPKYGIIGAAIATLIANFIHIILLVVASFRFIVLRIDYFRILIYLLSSVAMFVIVKNIYFDTIIATLFSRIFAGIIIYVSLVLLLDSDLRFKTSNFLGNSTFIARNKHR
jgi:O-antigen/teichoic acid export membrane protein